MAQSKDPGITVSSPSPLVMELGLSFSDQGRAPEYTVLPTDQKTSVFEWTAKNPFNYCKRWSKGGMRMNKSAGKSGDTLTGMLGRITEITSQTEKPKYCFVWGGGNDINNIANEAAIPAALAQMQADMRSIVAMLQSADIIPIVLDMPDNANWQIQLSATFGPFKLRTHYRFRQWLWEYCATNQIRFISTNQALSRPKTQVLTDATVSRPNSPSFTATVTQNNHGYAVGDWVILTQSGTSSANMTAFAAIAPTPAPDANTYTLQHTDNSGMLTNVPVVAIRSMLQPALTSDGTTHLTERGARRIAKAIWPALQPLFPPVDLLVSCNNDYYNLVGSGFVVGGVAPAIPQVSLSDFAGTGGTVTTTGTSTGNVVNNMPDNWDLNCLAGAPRVVITQVPGTDPPHENKNWLRLAITSALSTDTQFQIRISHTKPSAWAPSFGESKNNTWRRPTTETGLFAACVGTGTTSTTEPTWPAEVGKRVTDGTVTWEMRAGWKDGDVCWGGMEYWISAISSPDALEVLSLGLYDETDDDNSFKDHAVVNPDDGRCPEYEAGETGYLVTPEGVIAHGSHAVNFSRKIRVKGNDPQYTLTINLRRPTWRKVGLGA